MEQRAEELGLELRAIGANGDLDRCSARRDDRTAGGGDCHLLPHIAQQVRKCDRSCSELVPEILAACPDCRILDVELPGDGCCRARVVVAASASEKNTVEGTSFVASSGTSVTGTPLASTSRTASESIQTLNSACSWPGSTLPGTPTAPPIATMRVSLRPSSGCACNSSAVAISGASERSVTCFVCAMTSASSPDRASVRPARDLRKLEPEEGVRPAPPLDGELVRAGQRFGSPTRNRDVRAPSDCEQLGRRHYRVRWEDGRVSLYYPAGDATVRHTANRTRS